MNIPVLQKLKEATTKKKPALIIIGIVAGVILIGTISFTLISNRGLRMRLRAKDEEIARYQKSDKRLIHSIDSLQANDRERDKRDSVRQIRIDSLASRLTKLNNSNLITIHENYSTVSALPVNDFLSLLSGYVDSAEIKH